MLFLKRVVILAFAACLGTARTPLAQVVDDIIRSTPASSSAFWGIECIDLSTGRVAFELNSNRLFTPASTTKIFTSALALKRLGPSYRFVTRAVSDRPPLDGVLHGNLRLLGGGDPNLSARQLPYTRQKMDADPLRDIGELAEQIVRLGVRRVLGDIVGDDTAYVWEPYPPAWSIGDALPDYGAAVSALSLNDNKVHVRFEPGPHAGAPVLVRFTPPIESLVLLNRVRTVRSAPEPLHFEWLPGSKEVFASGALLAGGDAYEDDITAGDPALFAAEALRQALESRGVTITGTAAVRHRHSAVDPSEPIGTELARHTSHPLIEGLKVLDKISQNLHAELIFREVSRARTGVGSLKASFEELHSLMTEMGIPENAYHFEDGSGLSAGDAVTPAAVTKLLASMYRQSFRGQWVELYPVGGQDGTLANRFQNMAKAQYIHAKTGTLTGVAALAGYYLPPQGPRYAFTVIANHFEVRAGEITPLLDKIVMTLVTGASSDADLRIPVQ